MLTMSDWNWKCILHVDRFQIHYEARRWKSWRSNRKERKKKGRNVSETTEIDPILIISENHSKENVTSPYKESTKENTQKTETTKPSKPPKIKAIIPKPSDNFPSTSKETNFSTSHSPQPSSDALSLLAEEVSEEELQKAFKRAASLDFPRDPDPLFPPVVRSSPS